MAEPSALDLIAADLAGESLQTTAPPPKPKINKALAAEISKEVVTGDFAKSQAAHIGESKTKSALELISEDLGEAGKAKSLPTFDQEVVSEIAKLEEGKEKSAIDLINSELEGKPVRTRQEQPQQERGFLGRALGILSLDENAIAFGISKAAGFKDKNDFMDYTYTELLKDFGAPDTTTTAGVGLVLAIVASPATYLTFGASTAAKIGGKTFLSKKGARLVNEMIKESGEKKAAKAIQRIEVQKGVGFLSDDKKRKILNETLEKEKGNIENEVRVKFGDIDAANANIKKINTKVESLADDVLDKGGVKLTFPGTEKTVKIFERGDLFLFNKPVIKGATVARTLQRYKVPQAFEAMGETKALKFTKRTFIDPVLEFNARAKDTLGKAFIPNFGVEKTIVKLYDDFSKTARAIERNVEQSTQRFFRGMDRKEIREFGETMAEATGRSEPGEAVVRLTSSNKKVQNRLDKWLGFNAKGEKTRRSVQDEFAKRLGLFEDQKLGVWYPGIYEGLPRPKFQLPKDGIGPAQRLHEQTRVGDPSRYTTNPINAIVHRRLEMAFADLHDEMYGAIKSGKAGIKVMRFDSINDARKAGFDQLKPPALNELISGRKKLTDEILYIPKGAAADYNRVIRSNAIQIPGLTYATNLFKTHVTSLFPAFHARNFNSNIVLNAMRIGGQAVNPRNFKDALDAVRGTNLKKTITNDIGQKFTLEEMIEEAFQNGVIKSGQYTADLGGEMLEAEAKTIWGNMILWVNPLSTRFKVAAYGRKFGSVIEDQARMVNYLSWRKKGLSPKVAANEAAEALFDYGKVTRFEQGAKLMIPFYTFTRKNIENHIKILAHTPGVINAQLKFFRDLGPSEAELDQLPPWAQRNHVAKFGGNILGGFGLPVQDIIGLLDSDGREKMTRTNPIFRFPLERIIGQDFFSGRKISSINNAQEFDTTIMKVLENDGVPDAIKAPFRVAADMLKLERNPRGKVVGDPDRLHLLRNMFTSRWQSTLALVEKDHIPGMEVALRIATGIIKYEPDLSLSTSIAKAQSRKEIGEIVLKTNTARLLTKPIPVGGNPAARAYITEVLRMVDQGKSPSQIKAFTKRLGATLETKREQRRKARQ